MARQIQTFTKAEIMEKAFELMEENGKVELEKEGDGTIIISYFTGGSHGHWRHMKFRASSTYILEDYD